MAKEIWEKTMGRFFRNEAYIGLGEVPAHGIGMRGESPETEALIESGHLERVGEVPVYINGPEKGVVVKRVLKAVEVVGIVAAGAAITYAATKEVKKIRRKRKNREDQSK